VEMLPITVLDSSVESMEEEPGYAVFITELLSLNNLCTFLGNLARKLFECVGQSKMIVMDVP
jgi:hypothetical protein